MRFLHSTRDNHDRTQQQRERQKRHAHWRTCPKFAFTTRDAMCYDIKNERRRTYNSSPPCFFPINDTPKVKASTSKTHKKRQHCSAVSTAPINDTPKASTSETHTKRQHYSVASTAPINAVRHSTTLDNHNVIFKCNQSLCFYGSRRPS